MKYITVSNGYPVETNLSDDTVLVEMNGSGTTAATATLISATTSRTVVQAHSVDASNNSFSLPTSAPFGAIVEIYPDSAGPITVFSSPTSPTPTFSSGDGSIAVSRGALFRFLFSQWAYVSIHP